MLDSTTISLLVLGGIFLLILLWNARAFFSRIGGNWYEKKDAASPAQLISLTQIGPFVWGSAEVKGGVLRYSGWFNGKVLRLKRRDFGQAYLASLGFPEEVLFDLDGSEMAKATFRYDRSKGQLVGEHHPQKIDISRTRPPKVIGRVYLPSKPRTWTRKRPS